MKTASPSGASPSPSSTDDLRPAVLLAADAIGDLMGFWNFKPSMGQVWTVLYLSPRPLSAPELVEITGLSAGSVSMTLGDLQAWGVVKRAWVAQDRRRHFEAETDILALVTRVFRERELRWIDEVVERLERARALIDAAPPDPAADLGFLVARIDNLLGLARTGRKVVARFAQAGTLDLRAVRDVLGRRRHTG